VKVVDVDHGHLIRTSKNIGVSPVPDYAVGISSQLLGMRALSQTLDSIRIPQSHLDSIKDLHSIRAPQGFLESVKALESIRVPQGILASVKALDSIRVPQGILESMKDLESIRVPQGILASVKALESIRVPQGVLNSVKALESIRVPQGFLNSVRALESILVPQGVLDSVRALDSIRAPQGFLDSVRALELVQVPRWFLDSATVLGGMPELSIAVGDSGLVVDEGVDEEVLSALSGRKDFRLLSEPAKKVVLYLYHYYFLPILIGCITTVIMSHLQTTQNLMMMAEKPGEIRNLSRSGAVSKDLLNGYRVVTMARLQLRLKPTMKSHVLVPLPLGQLVKVLRDSKRSWLHVQVDIEGERLEGWAFRRYTTEFK
jgi:hypothetical protein